MRIALALCVLLVLAGCGPSQAGDTVFQTGKAAGQKEDEVFSWDFGQVTAEKKLEHSFVFTNKSKKTLELTGTGTSCGCTAAALEKTTLAPGESTQLKVTFDPKGYHGLATQHAYLNTDDPENPVYKFTIHAQVAQ